MVDMVILFNNMCAAFSRTETYRIVASRQQGLEAPQGAGFGMLSPALAILQTKRSFEFRIHFSIESMCAAEHWDLIIILMVSMAGAITDLGIDK